MSNQGEEGWYPECEDCGCGNLGKIYCENCYTKLKKKFEDYEKKVIEIVRDVVCDNSFVMKKVIKNLKEIK